MQTCGAGRGGLLAVWLIGTGSVQAAQIHFSHYGSFRIQAESVDPDDKTVLAAYEGFRDAYSHLGFNADYPLTDTVSLTGQLELPLDLVNAAVQDTWDQQQDIRIARFGVRGYLGTFEVGQMWLPFYNAIAAPVDIFSSYYSGFATYTGFRKGDTLRYSSPVWQNISIAASWSRRRGAAHTDGSLDNRLQFTATYQHADASIALGLDDLGGVANLKIFGVSLRYKTGAWAYAAKYEQHSSDLQSGYGADGDRAVNLSVSLRQQPLTYKLMLANVDNYGEDFLHLGIDYQVNARWRLFAEYYREEETAAITTKRGGRAETAFAASGGQVALVGMHYDF